MIQYYSVKGAVRCLHVRPHSLLCNAVLCHRTGAKMAELGPLHDVSACDHKDSDYNEVRQKSFAHALFYESLTMLNQK